MTEKWQNLLPVLLLLFLRPQDFLAAAATGNLGEICHADGSCVGDLKCIDYYCTCPYGYGYTKDYKCMPAPVQLGEPCTDDKQCPENAECYGPRCLCKTGFVPLGEGCLRKSFPGEPCIDAEQCPRLATCYKGFCECLPGTRTTATSCITFKGPKRNMKSLEVYKAAMIAAASLMVVVLIAFVACVIKKSFFDGGQPQVPHVFSVSEAVPPEVHRLAHEKPPPYSEVVRVNMLHEEPPSYADVMGASGSAHNAAFVPDT